MAEEILNEMKGTKVDGSDMNDSQEPPTGLHIHYFYSFNSEHKEDSSSGSKDEEDLKSFEGEQKIRLQPLGSTHDPTCCQTEDPGISSLREDARRETVP